MIYVMDIVVSIVHQKLHICCNSVSTLSSLRDWI